MDADIMEDNNDQRDDDDKRSDISDDDLERSIKETLENSENHGELSKPTLNKCQQNKKRFLVPWTSQQKTTAKMFYKNHIDNKRPPKQHEYEELCQKYPGMFDNKSWTKIKVFIQNMYSKKTFYDDK
ncbi:unnamed protein product [Psylliodes chrysocephalus]|uniref:Uncharacterized protein n=1 Tax=Psylliodes chrysocephalus TaxID=3402493 RepID=A0A9P0CXW2_9CUCU|nr:unnamed protein product [Psylliodes chrysocephala]